MNLQADSINFVLPHVQFVLKPVSVEFPFASVFLKRFVDSFTNITVQFVNLSNEGLKLLSFTNKLQ